MRTRTYPWLLPAVLILFLTQVVLFPFAMGFTYAGRNESPHHVLTYTTGSLTWNSATGDVANQSDDLDTKLGNNAANGNAPTVSITVKTTVTQID